MAERLCATCSTQLTEGPADVRGQLGFEWDLDHLCGLWCDECKRYAVIWLVVVEDEARVVFGVGSIEEVFVDQTLLHPALVSYIERVARNGDL